MWPCGVWVGVVVCGRGEVGEGGMIRTEKNLFTYFKAGFSNKQ